MRWKGDQQRERDRQLSRSRSVLQAGLPGTSVLMHQTAVDGEPVMLRAEASCYTSCNTIELVFSFA